MAQTLIRIKVGPTGMRLNEWVALEEGFYREAGFEVDMLWEQLKAEQGSWDTYKERPQDVPFLKGSAEITSACAWGSVCNAGAGMGKFIPTSTASLPGRSTCSPIPRSTSLKI